MNLTSKTIGTISAILVAGSVSAEPPTVKTKETNAISFQSLENPRLNNNGTGDGGTLFTDDLEPGRLHSYDLSIDKGLNDRCTGRLLVRITVGGVHTTYYFASLSHIDGDPPRISHDFSSPVDINFDPEAVDQVRIGVEIDSFPGTAACYVNFSGTYEVAE
jgi:hypothetical protein